MPGGRPAAGLYSSGGSGRTAAAIGFVFAVARALASRPEIVFADEPTGNLDSRSGGEVLGFLREPREELGQTIAMVTHDPVAASFADTAVFLADGRVVGALDRPTAATVLDYLASLETAHLKEGR